MEAIRTERERQHVAAFLGDCGDPTCQPCVKAHDDEDALLRRMQCPPTCHPEPAHQPTSITHWYMCEDCRSADLGGERIVR